MTASIVTRLEHLLTARLAIVGGAPPRTAAELVAAARERTGAPAFALRAAAFLVATSPLGYHLPAPLRTRAVGALLTAVLTAPGELLLYLGLAPTRETTACRGLLAP
jgi:hypothetical protein